MYYIYQLKSVKYSEQKYTGFTEDIQKRLAAHNNGQVPHTAKYKPWKIVNYFSFEDIDKAKSFELYLKSGSGRAFAKKHFW